MTYQELEKLLVESIIDLYGLNESKAIQRFLFDYLGGIDAAKYLLIRSDEADAAFELSILASIPRLLDSIPVQYIAGKTWFCGLNIQVEPGVLIPRPETEEMVNKIIENHQKERGLRVLDIGTGSGAIALSLCHFLNDAGVYALDVSKQALEIARKNARELKLDVHFMEIDILNRQQTQNLPVYDIIVSNPPYVKDSERLLMHKNVLDYEPETALFVPDSNPLIFYKAIASFAYSHLQSEGELWFEFNEAESENLRQQLTADGFSNITIFKDIHDKPRYLSCKKPEFSDNT